MCPVPCTAADFGLFTLCFGGLQTQRGENKKEEGGGREVWKTGAKKRKMANVFTAFI